ncbi:hypothetical protein D3C78_1148540 [compost metagenome]
MAAAVQHPAARRQILSLRVPVQRGRIPAPGYPPWREEAEGALFRSLPQWPGDPREPQPAAEDLPGAPVRGQLFQESHPALPAIPDQALQGALCRAGQSRRVRRGCAALGAVPRGAQQCAERRTECRHGEGRRSAGLRARRRVARPDRPAAPGAGPAEHGGRYRRRGCGRGDGQPRRRLRAPDHRAWRTGAGQQELLSAGSDRGSRGRRAGGLPRPVLSGQQRARPAERADRQLRA